MNFESDLADQIKLNFLLISLLFIYFQNIYNKKNSPIGNVLIWFDPKFLEIIICKKKKIHIKNHIFKFSLFTFSFNGNEKYHIFYVWIFNPYAQIFS